MTGKLNKVRITVAMLLALLTVVLMPLQVMAIPLFGEAETGASETITEPEAKILAEITEKRDAYTKHFLMDDGTYTAVQYDNPVHYQNKDNEWIEYDNRMVEAATQPETAAPTETVTAEQQDSTSASETSTQAVAENVSAVQAFSVSSIAVSDKEYENKKSNVDIRLSEKSKANNMVKIKADSYKISWGFADTAKSNVEFVKDNEALTGNDKFTTLKNITQEALYKDVYKNVDIQYFITPQSVKENLIIKDKDAQTDFSMQYKAKGLTAVQKDDKTIELKNKDGKVIYTLKAPFMTDADGVQSDAVTLTLTGQTDGRFTVKVIADSNWVKQWGRKFPVAVDPELNFGKDNNSTTTAFTSSTQPGTANKQQTFFYVGTQSTYGNCKGLVKLNQLPQLGEGDRVVDAKLTIAGQNKGTDIIFNAHNVTSAWDNKTAKQDNVTYDSSIIEYGKYNWDTNRFLSLDITQSFKSWSDGTLANNGILLETAANTYVSFGGYAYYVVADKPVFTVTYKNFIGTEPDLTYHTQTVGTNGEASVSDFLGSLVLRENIFQSTGARMPIAITATYNSILSNKIFNNGSPAGYGWQFSFNQYVSEPSESLKSAGYAYIYTDEDGTQHYFKLKQGTTTEWVDEDGLSLTLTKDTVYLYLNSPDGNQQKYTLPSAGGLLLSETDSNKNTSTYTYNTENNLTKITDGTGRVYTITYSVNPETNQIRVSSITAPDKKIVKFNYSAVNGDRDRVASITYPGNKSITFEYFSDGKMGGVILPDSSKIRYFYSNDKISEIDEYGTNGSQGSRLTITNNNDNTKVFTDLKNIKKTYTFDYTGKTISVLNADGYLMNSGSSSNSLNNSSSSDIYTKNYIVNSGLENTNGLLKKAWNSTDTGAFTLEKAATKVDDENLQYFGNASIKVEQTNTTDYTTFFQSLPTSGLSGKKITFSTYLKMNGIAKNNLQKGVVIKVRYLDLKNNEISFEEGKVLNGDQKWTRISETFTIPENAVKMEIHCGIKEAKGKAWFDCMQLEEGECMNDYNALLNSDFSTGGYWNGGQTISGTPDGKRALTQEVMVNKSNVAFNIYGSAAGKSVPLKADRKFGIKLSIYYANTSIPTEEHYQAFNEYTAAQQATCLLVLPEKPGEIINKVTVSFIYDYNVNNLIAYHAMLNVGGFEKPTSVMGFSETQTEQSVDSGTNDGIINSYDSFGNVIGSKQGTILTNADGISSIDTSKPFISSSKEYNATGNYIISQKDSRGNKTQHRINDSNGLVNSVNDYNGNTINYLYDAQTDKIVEMTSNSSAGTVTNRINYDTMNRYSSISQNGTSFLFSYDIFGNLKTSSIAGTTLATNTYENYSDNISSTTYGNGNVLNYTYDKSNNITEIKSKDSILMKSIYNKKGLLYKKIDESSGITSEYNYDIFGNLQMKLSYGKDSIAFFQNTYDVNENSNKKIIINGVEKNVGQFFDDDGNLALNNDGWIVYKTIDEFGRKVQERTVPPNSNNSYTIDYTYLNGEGTNSTTEIVSAITLKYGNRSIAQFSYIYDKNGNTTEIKQDGMRIATYSYDEINQLVYAADGKTKTFTFYTYDVSGNITNITKKGLEPSGWYPTTEIKSTDYTYGDSNWKDKLSSYDGQNMTYDSIGNPLNYRDGMTMTWKNVQQLATLKNGNNNITYQYNVDGLRTSKKIYNDSSKTSRETKYYYDDDNKLIGIYGLFGNIMHIYYDSYGNISSMSYAGNMYYYVKDLQGNVIKLMNADGTVAANYSYDACGEITSITDANGNAINSSMHIGLMNPFRYRGYVYDDETGLYYLQSRYYDPVTARFINADTTIGANQDIQSNNLFAYCSNNFVNCIDPNGCAKVYAMYYNNPGSGFGAQAFASPYYASNSKDTHLMPFITKDAFVYAWSHMPNSGTDKAFLYLHGGPGVLYFKGQEMNIKTLKSKLKSKRVSNRIYLFSCEGGYGYYDSNVAYFFAHLTGTPVVACTGGVCYNYKNKKYYPRISMKHPGTWRTFVSNKSGTYSYLGGL